MIRTLTVDDSRLPNQPVLSDDETLDQAFADPRLRKTLIRAFTRLQNQIIDLQNTVNNTNTPSVTPQQVKGWLINRMNEA